MQKIVKDGEVRNDDWQKIEQPDSGLPDGKLLLPMQYWLQNRQQLAARNGSVGIWIDSHEEVEALGDAAQTLPVIGIHFPKFADGRGFSTARLLRERYSYKGEVRAIGPFIRDQLFYMKRCGFDAFQFAPEVDPDSARQSLNDFSNAYQGATDQPEPLFRRR